MSIYILLLLIALVCGLSLGWFGRKLIGRIEQLEAVTKRRRLPNPTLAALEDISALADMASFESGDTDKVLLTVLTLLLKKRCCRTKRPDRICRTHSGNFQRDPRRPARLRCG